MTDRVVYQSGGYFAGVPARDMPLDEWVKYPKELRKAALKQGLYKIITCEEEAEAESAKSEPKIKKPCEVENA